MGVSMKLSSKMGDKYQIEWKLFQENLSEAMKELRNDRDFFNVTLAFDDENCIEAHSFVLSACSTVLKRVIKRNKDPHTFIFLSGHSSTLVSHLVDFMYHGEVSVPREEVDS